MKFNLTAVAAVCALASVFTGCSKSGGSSGGESSPLLNSTDKATSAYNSAVEAPAPDPEEADCSIKLEDGNITVSGSGAKVTDNTVSITGSGVYELSGSSADCKIEINAGKKANITLILNGVTMTSKSGSVIDCESAETLTLFLKPDSQNSLSDSESYPNAADGADAAVFTRSDLIINGTGELTVNGGFGDAVKCKDALKIYSGNITVNSADDGITGKDSVTVVDGSITVNAGGDGIKSTNDTDEGRGNIIIKGGEISVNSAADGIQAEKALTVENGVITIVSGGDAADAEIKQSSGPWDFNKRGGQGQTAQENSESHKGLKAGGDIVISGGEINVKAADDSIHSNANVKVENGLLTLSSCDDGIHADENLTISDGTINVTKSYEGLEGKSIDIRGGSISVKAVDDGLNAAGGDNASFFGYGQASDDYYISISGGNITVDADGDGVDSNGTIAQSGGVLTVFGPTNSGNGALDYERSYVLSGGTLIALGSIGMAQAPSTLSQPCLSVNYNAAAGSKIEVRTGNAVILETTTPKMAQSLIFSSEKMEIGTEYEIYVGGELAATVTAADGVSGSGANGQGGFPGGGHGGFPGGGQGGFPGEPGGGQGGGPGGHGGERPGRDGQNL